MKVNAAGSMLVGQLVATIGIDGVERKEGQMTCVIGASGTLLDVRETAAAGVRDSEAEEVTR